MARFDANLEKEAFIREGEGFFLGKVSGEGRFLWGGAAKFGEWRRRGNGWREIGAECGESGAGEGLEKTAT